MQRLQSSPIWMTILAGMTGAAAMGQSNIAPDHKLAWGENIGWTNWRDADNAAQGVVVNDTFLSGHVWAENVGWVNVGNGPVGGETYANIDDTDFGVNVDIGTGYLSGYGWAENVGWINFDTSSLGSDRARFDAVDGRFRGYAWGENIGLVNLDDATHFVAMMGGGDIPTVSEWGLVVMTLLVLTAGTLVCARRRMSTG